MHGQSRLKISGPNFFCKRGRFGAVHHSERKDRLLRRMAAGIHGGERLSLEHFNGSLMMCVQREEWDKSGAGLC